MYKYINTIILLVLMLLIKILLLLLLLLLLIFFFFVKTYNPNCFPTSYIKFIASIFFINFIFDVELSSE